MATRTHSGGCLCGAIRFTVPDPLAPGEACHCCACRKQTGHYLVTTAIDPASLALTGEASLRWYPSSETIRRGFCGTCGSVLFWGLTDETRLWVTLGSFDGPTGTTMKMHIHVAEQGDYYVIGDPGVPRHP